MTQIIEKPPLELVKKWGPLAHVDEKERQRILGLPAGQFEPAVVWIEKQLKALKKRRR